MNLTEKGWYKQHLEYRKGLYGKGILHTGRHHDMSLYSLLQPTGILYGTPVAPENLDIYDFDSISDGDKLKILNTESLINTCLLFNESNIKNEDDYVRTIDKATKYIISFYSGIFPHLKVRDRTLWGAEKLTEVVAEEAISKRIYSKLPGSNEFWSHFFYSSLIFLDIYLFGQWINLKSEKIVTDYFRQEKEDLRFTVLKIMLAAASANYIIEKEERVFLDQFLKVAEFSKSTEKSALALMSDGISIDEIELPQNNSWLLKKFFLELAILTVWADSRVDEFEETFLENLSNHLGFVHDDVVKSKIAVEGFIISNWEEMEGLHNTKNPEKMKKDYLGKILSVTQRNESKLREKLKGNEPMTRLINKYQSEEINPEDSKRLRDFLIDCIQQLPAFRSILLPHALFTLPVLFKLIPQSN